MSRFKVTVEQPPETEEFAVDVEIKRNMHNVWLLTYASVPLPKKSPRRFTLRSEDEEMLRDLLKRNGYLVRHIEELPSA